MTLPGTVKKYLLVLKRIRFLKKLYPLSTIAKDVVLLPFDIWLRRGGTSRINNITIVLTDRCNARCSVCFFDKNLNKQEDRLTFDVVKQIIDDVSIFKPSITLTGGEPLLHKEIEKIICYVKGRGLPLMIFTNGFFLDRVTDAIIRHRVDYVGVSIFGPRDIHNRVTRTDSFDKVAGNLRALIAQKKETQVIINCTITEENVENLSYPLELAKELGCDGVRYQHLGYLTRQELENLPPGRLSEMASLHVTPHNPGIKILQALRKLRIPESIKVQFVPTLSAEEMERWYSDEPGVSIERRCLYIWRGVHIHSSGDVYPCFKISYPLGNVLQESILSILNNARYKDIRLLFKDTGMIPLCRRCCKL